MNPFPDACGATGPLVLSVEAPGAATADTHRFEQPFVLIGRDPRCGLRLDHPEVSDRHAYLQLVAGRLVCLDLGSRHGVYQGGRRRRVIDVARDQSIRIGPYRIRLVAGDEPAADPGAAPLPDRRPLVLELSHRALRQSRCELAPGLALVGSGDCLVRLVDPAVSSYHASLVRTAAGLWVVDLLGQSGVRLNGRSCMVAQLAPGDSIELGHSSVSWAADAATSPPQPAAAAASIASAPLRAEAATQPQPQPAGPRLGVSLTVVGPTESGLTRVQRIAPTTTPQDRSAPAVSVPRSPAPLARAGADEAGSAPLPVAHAAEIVERVLTPLVNQVGLIQQQMIDDFHRAREGMLSSFASLYDEQTAVLSREVEQLRQLGQELHDLRAELERQTRALDERLSTTVVPTPVFPTAALNVSVPGPAAPAASASASASASQARLGSAVNSGPRPPASPIVAGPVPSAPVEFKNGRLRLNGSNGAAPGSTAAVEPAPRERAPRPVGPEADLDLLSHLTLNGGGLVAAPEPSICVAPQMASPSPSTPAPGTASNDDIHARLCDRISQIQDEHQSRWRKLLGLFSPSSSAKPAS